MTRILPDSAGVAREPRHGVAADLAQRFEWRLRFEKAQIEQRERLARAAGGEARAGVRAPVAETAAAQRSPVADPAEFPEGVRAETPAPVADDEQVRQDVPPRSPVPGTTGTTVPVQGAAAGNTDVRAAPPASRSDAPAAPRPARAPLPAERPALALHVYRAGETVEVALRDPGFVPGAGARLLGDLRRTLASLGLRLAKLTVNGQRLQRPDASGAGDAPIDRIY